MAGTEMQLVVILRRWVRPFLRVVGLAAGPLMACGVRLHERRLAAFIARRGIKVSAK